MLKRLIHHHESEELPCISCGPIQYYHDMVDSIITALEAKDIHTANHSRRVSDMAERFCSVLRVTAQENIEIHLAAHVHDIGKIAIPDAILSKSSSLTAEEWEVMKSHPVIGSRILGTSDLLGSIGKIVLHHHERWDGNGYPDGLSGIGIPYGSRIIALCDSVDAMLSERPYRAPLSMSLCRSEIIAGSSLMYDPGLTDIFIRHWNEIIAYKEYGGYQECVS